MERKRSRERNTPNFAPSGILANYENRKNGEIMLYTEPLDCKVPDFHWQLFQFKDNEEDPIRVDLCDFSFFTIGRDNASTIKIAHQSISKQHGVIQFKQRKREVLPYLIDLNSKFGSSLNGKRVDSSRFYELRHKDLLKFGSFPDDFILIKGDKLP